MAISLVLLRTIAKNAAKHAANLLTFGVAGDLLKDIWEDWHKEQNESQRRAEVERLVAARVDEVRAEAHRLLGEFGGHLTPEQWQRLADWLTQTPAAIRRSLRRPAPSPSPTPTSRPSCTAI